MTDEVIKAAAITMRERAYVPYSRLESVQSAMPLPMP